MFKSYQKKMCLKIAINKLKRRPCAYIQINVKSLVRQILVNSCSSGICNLSPVAYVGEAKISA